MKETLAAQIAANIIDLIHDQALPVGHHLSAQKLADQFKVSRGPVNAALKMLAEGGAVYAEPNRGYFVARVIERLSSDAAAPTAGEDRLYFTLAEDRLSGRLPNRVSESEMMRHYGVSRGRLQALLFQIAEEGWVERLPGHGWEFKSTLSTAQSYQQAYRFRAVIESEAVRLPQFSVNAAMLAQARAQQLALLAGDMFTLSRAQLFEINSTFHEMIVAWSGNSFFLDALKRVNRLRRLVEYRVTLDRGRLKRQCEEHLSIIEQLESGDYAAAADFLRAHIDNAWAVKESWVELPSKAGK